MLQKHESLMWVIPKMKGKSEYLLEIQFMSVTLLDLGAQCIMSRCLSSSPPSQTDLQWGNSPVQYNVISVIYEDINIPATRRV